MFQSAIELLAAFDAKRATVLCAVVVGMLQGEKLNDVVAAANASAPAVGFKGFAAEVEPSLPGTVKAPLAMDMALPGWPGASDTQPGCFAIGAYFHLNGELPLGALGAVPSPRRRGLFAPSAEPGGNPFLLPLQGNLVVSGAEDSLGSLRSAPDTLPLRLPLLSLGLVILAVILTQSQAQHGWLGASCANAILDFSCRTLSLVLSTVERHYRLPIVIGCYHATVSRRRLLFNVSSFRFGRTCPHQLKKEAPGG